jgi:sugar lactone lactonase YvrE
LASMYEGKRLNSPNDITVRSDGAFYFTDPPYGINPGESELGFSGIYLYTGSGELLLLDKSLYRPNGIALSPDESILYASDAEVREIYTWEIDGDTILNKTLFASMTPSGYADGMKVDENGFLYATGPGGIWMYHPDGTFIRTIPVPGQVTNCGWGAKEDTILFVTTGNYLYMITNKKEDPVTFIVDNTTKNHNLKLLSSNPFVDNLRFSCYLKDASYIKLEVYDHAGRMIQRLAERNMDAGEYTYFWEAVGLCAGNYFISLNCGKSREVIQCVKLDN